MHPLMVIIITSDVSFMQLARFCYILSLSVLVHVLDEYMLACSFHISITMHTYIHTYIHRPITALGLHTRSYSVYMYNESAVQYQQVGSCMAYVAS